MRHDACMKRPWIWWATLSAVGVATIAIPDTGPPLFSISQIHGPSLLDTIGIGLLVAGWAVLDVATWRRRRRLPLSPRALTTIAVVAAGAAGLVLWSVLGDRGLWWIVGSVVLAVLQLAAAARVTSGERSRS